MFIHFYSILVILMVGYVQFLAMLFSTGAKISNLNRIFEYLLDKAKTPFTKPLKENKLQKVIHNVIVMIVLYLYDYLLIKNNFIQLSL